MREREGGARHDRNTIRGEIINWGLMGSVIKNKSGSEKTKGRGKYLVVI